MNNSEIEKHAHGISANKLAQGEVVILEWAVQEIIVSSGTITGDGVPFYELCAREHVRRIVKKVVDKYDGDSAEDPKQIRFEGFDHLHVAYSVVRDGQRVLVPIQHISDEELLARAAQYDDQALGSMAHAKEIRLYVNSRKSELQASA